MANGLTDLWTVRRYSLAGVGVPELDALAVEEPLELRQRWEGQERPLAVLMRTPGADRELLRGWLHAEAAGLSGSLSPHPENPNVWFFGGAVPPEYLARETSGACGICGSGSIERLLLRVDTPPEQAGPRRTTFDPAWLATLPQQLQANQSGFSLSGGLHGAALFAAHGPRLCLFEDIGRHNATDKVVGWALDHPELDRAGTVLVLSSRLGYEIVQKAVLAGIGAVVGVGAATTLAAQTAQTFGLLLAGWARAGRLTVYAGAERLQDTGSSPTPKLQRT